MCNILTQYWNFNGLKPIPSLNIISTTIYTLLLLFRFLYFSVFYLTTYYFFCFFNGFISKVSNCNTTISLRGSKNYFFFWYWATKLKLWGKTELWVLFISYITYPHCRDYNNNKMRTDKPHSSWTTARNIYIYVITLKQTEVQGNSIVRNIL